MILCVGVGCSLLLFVICVVRRLAAEDVDHLYLLCPYAQRVWMLFLGIFQVRLTFRVSFVYFLKELLQWHFSSQVHDLWLAGIVVVVWGIWLQRNACKFDSKSPHFGRLCHGIIRWVKEGGDISKGTMNNVVLDLLIIKKFGVPCGAEKLQSFWN